MCSLAQTRPRPDRGAIERHYPQSYVSFAAETSRQRSRASQASHQAALVLRWASFVAYRRRFRAPPRFPSPEPGRARLLDVGTGAGFLIEAMTRLGWRAQGIEPSAEAAAYAERRAGLAAGSVRVSTAEMASFDESAFDLITVSHVLEHLHDPRRVLTRLREWLADDGRLIIWCPNFGSFESRFFGRLWYGLDVPRHLYHFTPETLTRLLADTGFRVERIVAEQQSATLAGSLQQVWEAALRRRRPLQVGRVLHHAVEPLAGFALAAGDMPSMHVTALRDD